MCNSALGLQMHLRLNYLSIYLKTNLEIITHAFWQKIFPERNGSQFHGYALRMKSRSEKYV